MPFLPVDTAVVVEIGPCIDDSTFKDLETAIAHNAAGMSVDLIKNSGTAITKVDITPTTDGANDWTHKGNGVYELEITEAQNDTEGTLRIVGVCDGVLPFESPVYTVLPTVVYNSLIAGSDYLQTDAVQVEGSDATNQIRDAAVAKVVDGTLDVAEVLKVLLAVLGGDVTKSSNTYAFKDQAGATKITWTVGETSTDRTIA